MQTTETKSEHTPGPWRLVRLASRFDARVHSYGVAYGRVGNRLAIVDGEGNSYDANEANARLIAAAPTMYDYVSAKAEAGDAVARSILEMIHAGR